MCIVTKKIGELVDVNALIYEEGGLERDDTLRRLALVDYTDSGEQSVMGKVQCSVALWRNFATGSPEGSGLPEVFLCNMKFSEFSGAAQLTTTQGTYLDNV